MCTSSLKKKKYLDSVTKAANFLVKNQALDGSWIKYNYGNKNHVYDTRVAWALLIVSQLFTQLRKPKKAEVYKHAAVKNLDWALTFQQKNGWFRNNELPPPNIQLPYTHTISYALEGFLWSALITKKRKYLNAAIAGALPIAEYYLKHDFIPGTFDYQWQSQDTYTCLTGDAQLALVWLTLYERTKNPIFKKAGYRINAYLRKIQNTQTSNKNIRGGISGSWPLWGDVLQNKGYCRLAYINWGAKFFIDAQLKELHLREQKK